MKKVFLDSDSGIGKALLSCEFWEISKNIFFIEHIWATASGSLRMIKDGKISVAKETISR